MYLHSLLDGLRRWNLLLYRHGFISLNCTSANLAMHRTCGTSTVFFRILDPLPIIAVNDADQIVGSLVVVTSQKSRPPSDLVLASVPHDATRAFVFHRLIIETDGRDCGRHIARL